MINNLIALSRQKHHRTAAFSGGGSPPIIPGALVQMDEGGIVLVNGLVTEFQNNLGSGGAAFDFDVLTGTTANLRRSISAAVLSYGGTAELTTPTNSIIDLVTGSFEIRVRVTLDDYTPAVNQDLMSKWNGGLPSISYVFQLLTTGFLNLAVSTDGISAAFSVQSSIVLPTIDGDTTWINVTYNIGTNEAIFGTSTEDTNDPIGLTFTQLGTIRATNSIPSVFVSSTPLAIGSNFIGDINGSIHRGVLYSGINGTIVADMTPASYVSGTTFVSSRTGETWTLGGNMFIQNTGHNVVHSIGSVSMESTINQLIPSPFVMYAVMRATDPAPPSQHFINGRDALNERAILFTLNSGNDRFALYQGGTAIVLVEPYDTDVHVFVGEFNGDSTTKLTVSGVGEITGDAGNNANFGWATLLGDQAGASTMKCYIASVLVYNGTHTAEQVAQNIAALETKYNITTPANKFLLLPGASGDYASTPDSAAASVTSDIDLRLSCSLDDWTPASSMALISKRTPAGTQNSYYFRVFTSGAFQLFISQNGTNTAGVLSTVVPGFVDGSEHGIRATWNNTTDTVQFFTRSDSSIENDSGWDQLGTDVALARTGIFDSTSPVEIGARENGTVDVMAGKVNQAVIKNGINGTTVVDFNPDDYISGSSFVSTTTGETWTINGNASIST